MNVDLDLVRHEMERLAIEAGKLLLDLRGGKSKALVAGDENSLRTADRTSEELIVRGLSSSFPGIAIVAEERAREGDVPEHLGELFFLVDPLDGSTDFKAGSSEYAVNIALVRGQRPILGVMYLPSESLLYSTRPEGAVQIRFEGSGKIIKMLRCESDTPLSRGIVSRARPNASVEYLRERGIREIAHCASTIKFCKVAAGEADVYACIGGTSQWDTAAGDAILEAAGGSTSRISDGIPISYGRNNGGFQNPHFIARRPVTSERAKGLTPRDYVEYAPVSNDCVDDAVLDDKLDVSNEALAFARIAAAKEVRPPLAFGVFGDWGSGKSYFMRLMQKHIDELCREKYPIGNMIDQPFHSRVVQIRFNAWHYVDSNLWASLVHTIFEELDKWCSKGPLGEQDTVLSRLTTARELTLDAAERLMDERQKQKEAADRLACAEGELSTLRANYKPTPQAFWAVVRLGFDRVAKSADFREAAEEAGLVELSRDIQLLNETFAALSKESTRGRVILKALLGKITKGWSLLALGAIIVLLPLFISVISSCLEADLPGLAEAIRGATVQLGLMAASLLAFARWLLGGVYSGIIKLEAFSDDLDNVIAETLKKPIRAVDEAREHLSEASARLAEAEADLLASSQRLSYATSAYARETGRERLLRFVKERASDDGYSRHLGLVATIRRDLAQLSSLIADADDESVHEASALDARTTQRQKALIKRAIAEGLLIPEEVEQLEHSLAPLSTNEVSGFNRIVLYVDDLDRCPPQKVIEVLQAVHLLLSFQLFVVVVAVDVRWIERCLEETYINLLGRERGRERASTSDYLEKIFQVPYWVRSITSRNSRAFTEALLKRGGGIPAPRSHSGQTVINEPSPDPESKRSLGGAALSNPSTGIGSGIEGPLEIGSYGCGCFR